MAIIALPDDIRMHSDVVCVICGDKKSLQTMTAGVRTADGQQAFSCESHRQERTAWTLGWLMLDAPLPLQAAQQPSARIIRV